MPTTRAMEAQFQTLLEKLTEMKSDLTASMNANMGEMKSELTASMNVNMGEMKSELTASMNANMTEMKSELTANKEELKSDLMGIGDKLTTMDKKFEEMEGRIKSVENKFENKFVDIENKFENKFEDMESKLEKLKQKVMTGQGDEFKFQAPYSKPSIKLSTYDGKSSWQVYKTQFSIVADVNQWDSQTKACQLAASLRADAADILQTLPETQHWISRYGVPLQLHSDQGRNFVSAVLKGVCELLGIDKTKTTPLHPQSDGMVERFNRTILNNLSLMVSKNQQDWDQKVPLFLLAYRSAVHETTGYSPSQMLFGRDLRLPCDLLFGRPPDTPSSPEEYVQNLQARFEDVHNLARERINLRTEKMKTRYDTKATGHQFKEGDLYMSGLRLTEELYLSALDLEMYTSKDFWRNISKRVWAEYMPFTYEKDSAQPCSFSEIFSDQYPAAYFSNLWAEMIAADVFNAFEEAGLDNDKDLQKISHRFRDTFLSLGGGCHPSEVFRKFRGRDPSTDALVASLGLTTKTQN
ncbi:probable cytosolic oligopeptidase A [Trichonephila clavipes]|nr:probable cytosolic oligopeptidase A [Trichonephila clavipes]